MLLLGSLCFAQEQYEQATEVYRQLLAHESFLEVAHRELIRCYARQGEHGQALRTYQDLVDMMRDEFVSLPAPETTALIERLRRGEEI
jgi:pentatricopeptide repeat protein